MVTQTLKIKIIRQLDRRWAKAKKPWTEEELEILGNKYGLISDRALARLLQRSPNAIHVAAVRYLHQSRSMNFYTARNVAEELGIACSKTIIYWLQRGWIFGRQCSVGAGINKRWMFKYENILRCLKSRPWLCDLKDMPEGYFRTIVQAEYDKDPWYNCEETGPLLGVMTHDAVQRYIRKGWLKADKKPGGPQHGRWVIRHSDIQIFLANDPRPTKSEIVSGSRRRAKFNKGLPVRLSVHWSVLCRACGQRVLVMADPGLDGPQVQELVTKIYTNGHCTHGLKCTIGFQGTLK